MLKGNSFLKLNSAINESVIKKQYNDYVYKSSFA